MRKRNSFLSEESLAKNLLGALVQVAHRLWQATKTLSWLTVQPSTVNETELGVQEWRDALFLRYVPEPPELHKLFDGCSAAFSVCLSLDLNKGGLVIARHKKLRDGVGKPVRKILYPNARA